MALRPRRPVEVVDEPHARCRPRLERNRLTCTSRSLDPVGDRLLGVERALGRGPRVADEAGRAADQAEGLVPGELDAAQDEQLHEVAQVQARRRRVESAVVRDRIAGEQLLQRGLVGRHVHEAAPDELLPDVVEGRVIVLGCEDHGVGHPVRVPAARGPAGRRAGRRQGVRQGDGRTPTGAPATLRDARGQARGIDHAIQALTLDSQ